MASTAIHQIYNFPTEFVENVSVLPNGHLLLSTIKSKGLLYTIDPTVSSPQPQQAVQFDDSVTAVTGLVPLENGLFAVGGGLHTSFAFEKGSVHVYIVSLESGRVVSKISVPDTATINGMASLPGAPHIILGADSIEGRIFSIDTHTGNVTVALKHDALGPGPVTPGQPQIGINGLRVRDNHAYFTNSNQRTFGRIRIDRAGGITGDIEILARSLGEDQLYDDFTFDRQGNAYIAVHPSSVVKVTPKGVQTTIAGCEIENSPAFNQPTSAALGNDGTSIYVVTGGLFYANPKQGGQVIRIAHEGHGHGGISEAP
ncbi:hypothetical protein F4808DRAFT_432442 [Astrocystis sublimbata]|nr:hypothetical protein F4808DRAFT_432442 [Astrocystis sublimbata]